MQRPLHLIEGVEDLVHCTQRDLACHDSGSENDVGEYVVDLQIDDAADVEIHVVEIEIEIVPAHSNEQFAESGRRGAVSVVFTVNEFLAEGGLDALVLEFKARKPDADEGEESRCRIGPTTRQ